MATEKILIGNVKGPAATADTMKMSGYVKGTSAAAVASTDNILKAVGKLENQVETVNYLEPETASDTPPASGSKRSGLVGWIIAKIKALTTATNELNSNITGYNSDDNGRRWWKFPDGTLICSRRLQATVKFSSGWGSSGLYLTQSVTLGSFPASFIETPTLTVSIYSAAAVITGSYSGTTNAVAGEINLIRAAAADANVTLSYIAIGRWK